MHSYMIRNGTQFPMQQLKIVKGTVPKSILGSYIKNGPGLLTMDKQVLPHWFFGNSGMLKVEFHDGKVYGKYKMVQTPAYKRDLKQKNFWRQNVIWSIVKNKIGLGEEYNSVNNSASTSILRVPNSEKYYALYEGGLAYRMEEKTMNEEDFDDFGFVQKGFSAHPKVDPDNGDIFNIGFNIGTCDLYRMSKDLKLICKNSFKTRIKQSIHDCCLAGDYFVVFECPISMNMWKFAKGYPSLNCYAFDYQDGKTIAYIYKKDTLEFVKRIELNSPEPFMMYHFTNGYMQNNKIFVEYVKYPGENAQKILDLVEYAPNYAVKEGQKKHISLFSQLQTVEISLQDFSQKYHPKGYDCEFPLCEDNEVGKKWKYSYFIAKTKGDQFFNFNRLVRYDQEKKEALEKHFPGCCIVQPSLIRTTQGLFILILKSSPERCSLQILEGDKFQTIAEIQLPEYIPFGFHGKWLQMNDKKLLQSEKI